MFGNEIAKVAGSVTQEPYKVVVAGVELEVPRPVIRTQVAVSGIFGTLGSVPAEPSYEELVAHLGKAGRLAEVASLYIKGRVDKRLIQTIEKRWSIPDLVGFVMEMMTRGGDFETFFGFTTSLKDRNLLKPTKGVREVETASGLSSEASPTTTI